MATQGNIPFSTGGMHRWHLIMCLADAGDQLTTVVLLYGQDDRETADDNLDDAMLKEDIESILGELTEREAGVIRLRFGIGVKELTLEEIGDHFQVTRERIRQIEAKAVRKLKAKQQQLASKLTEYKAGMATEREGITGRVSRGTKKT